MSPRNALRGNDNPVNTGDPEFVVPVVGGDVGEGASDTLAPALDK